MQEINPWLLASAIFIGILIGFFFTLFYITYKAKKLFGVKNWKELESMIKKSKEMEEKLKKGNMSKAFEDPEFRKRMEEIKKMFDRSV